VAHKPIGLQGLKETEAQHIFLGEHLPRDLKELLKAF